MIRNLLPLLCIVTLTAVPLAAQDLAAVPIPAGAKLVLDEDWVAGTIDPKRWYVPRKKWGHGNHGVVPENVNIVKDTVFGKEKNVIVCTAHGDQYDGPVVGMWGRRQRVGGVIVSKDFFASGRYEVVMKLGAAKPHDGGPKDPMRPQGTVAAIWTFGYRFVQVDKKHQQEFVRDTPMYNPHMQAYGGPFNEYWSELDFPEFGKAGLFKKAMYNTFLQNKHLPLEFDIEHAVDGQYHTYTTEWRTMLAPIKNVTDAQVVEHEGYWWVQDKAIPFHHYYGNPLKRIGKDEYQVYTGRIATHWIDGKKVAENRRFVPAMTAQLTMGVWLPDWAGPAPWKTSSVSFASAKVWQYHDEGDVRGVITQDIHNNFEKDGREIK